MWNAKTASKTPIKIDDTIKTLLPSWESNPSSFFHYSSIEAHFKHELLPARMYLYLRHLRQNQAADTVRWRLFLLAFYQLKEDFNRKRLRSGAQADFIGIIRESGLVKETDDEIGQNCTAWANAGGRYNVLAEELGGRGALLLLPDNIPRNM